MVNLNYIQKKEELLIAFKSLSEVFTSTNHPLFSEWFKNSLNDYLTGTRVLFEIRYSNTVVGYVLIHYFDKFVKLNAIIVFSEFRRKGIAEESCKKVIDILKNKKDQLLFTQIRPEYSNAKRLFEKLNFFQIGTIFNSDEQRNNDLYCLKLNDFTNVEFVRETALTVYKKNNIVWTM